MATLTPSQRASAPDRGQATAPLVVEDVSKAFKLPHEQYHTLKERVLHPFKFRGHDRLEALQHVSLEVQPGEFFGIVGRNGSGKSTLLKCIAGIYQTDSGSISVNGRLSPFIELGVGFNPDLTARDNVLINATMLGLTRKQAKARFDDIIAFAELEPFLELKLKNYSSGMQVRLAFSVAVQVDAEILLVDEVLAVGDAAFQQKCYEQFQRMKDEGRTIVLVTHDMGAVARFCDRAMLLERGEVAGLGEPNAIGRHYHDLNFGRVAQKQLDGGERRGDRRGASIDTAWFEGRSGERVSAVGLGEPLRFCFEVEVHEPLVDPVFSVVLRNDGHQAIIRASTEQDGVSSGRFEPGERAVVRLDFENILSPNRYWATASVALPGSGADITDERVDIATLVVHGVRASGAVVDLPHEFRVERR
ncbi:MAG: type transport system ATP-binding protein [Thermoleophilaceae bacterium]|nr:type transport system ATP-binding protein [Thermoleophilaceae bacterium]